MVNSLARQYAAQGKNIIFVAHDIDHPTGQRKDRWFAAYGKSGSVTIPLVMLDSGNRWSNGNEKGAFEANYTKLVNDELKIQPMGEITAFYQRDDAGITVRATVKYLGRETLDWYENDATVHVMVYEDTQVIHIDHFVRAGIGFAISEPLERNQTGTYDIRLDISDDVGVNWPRANVLVFVDYRPDGGKAYNMIQAAVAHEGMPTPTPEPTATEGATPTATVLFFDTATPEPTATETPTPEPPTPTATSEPVRPTIYLPVLHRLPGVPD